MAFNNVGAIWLGPGQSSRHEIAYDAPVAGEPEWGGSDAGAQWIMADPIGLNPATLLVKDHTKLHKARRNSPGDPIVSYAVTVVNIGSDWALFSLQGGGCT